MPNNSDNIARAIAERAVKQVAKFNQQTNTVPGPAGASGATGPKGDKGPAGPEAPYWSDAVMTGTDGFVTVNFPTGMFTEPPQVEATAVNPTTTANPNGENRAYNAEIVGDPTTTQARIRVRAYPMGTVTVLLGAVTVNESPGKAIKVLVTATKRRTTL